MKKTLLTILAMVLLHATTLIAAEDDMATKLQRKQDMQMLASGLKLLQDGLIYNNRTQLQTAVEMIQKGEKNLLSAHGDDLKNYLPEETAYAYKYAEKAAKRIATYTKELSDYIKDEKDYTKISETFSYIINECAGCHMRIRKY